MSFIIAFRLCFFIIYHHPEGATNEDGEEINGYFVNPNKSLMKTIFMILTGEIEFEDIEYSSRIIFLVYVFFIMLILVNLLNGISVSDTADIQKQAEIMSHVSRVELSIESIFLGDPFTDILPSLNLFAALYRVSFIRTFFPSLKIFLLIGGGILMFDWT